MGDNSTHEEAMMKKCSVFAIFAIVIILFFTSGVASSQTQPQQKPAAPAGQQPQTGAAEAPKVAPVERPFAVTKHMVTIDGKPVPYTATAGELVVLKPNELPGATMFFVAYTRDDTKDRSSRPLMFAFNGGPGSSTVWLHLGGLGPKRVAMDDEGRAVAPPYGLVDSENSLLDVTDLIFVDAVSTGYSRPLPGENKNQFHGVQEDVATFGEFIRAYITKYDRWSSPKFILGESYGTTRAAGLSGYLQNRTNGMYLNGIILLSSVLDFQTLFFAPAANVPYVVFLPHYTATAWYHKRLPADLQAKPLRDVLAEAETFALGPYGSALLKGNRLTPAEYEETARKLAAYTGLKLSYVKQSNLRIPHEHFVKELRRDDLLTVGRLDSRFTGRDADAAGESTNQDPSSSAIQGAFSTVLNDYLRTVLNYKKDSPYAVYGNVYPWNFSYVPPEMAQMVRGGSLGAPNLSETLRQAMADNPFLQVFCCEGYYDGATPYFGTEYTFSQIGLNGEFKDRVKTGTYEAGHMMYIHKPSLLKLKKDLAGFVLGASHR
jgi:carboxypeptidase C (cathepsin A)